MLHMYVMDKPSKWEDYIHLEKIAYNKKQHETLNTSPFEALYGRKFRMLVNSDDLMNKEILGLEFIQEMEHQVTKIR